MANTLYDLGRQGFLDGSINWSTGNIKAMLVLSTYTFSNSHKFVSDISAYDNGRSANLGTKTVAAGVAGAANTSIVATAASACSAIVLFQDSGTDSTSRLIAYIDTPSSGLPMTPSAGQTVNVNWDTGANKIFKL